MTGADVYYRAFRAFKRSEADNYAREREKIKESVSLVADSSDLCEYSFMECSIESDWIVSIEEGLEHIEKTIEAQRRFIKYEGDTVRIEKAKRTTVESVKHLSKHSNLIKEERGDSVMPEKLYVVENEENFAVYENRFIYMLLTMLNNFVSVRYKAITNARTRARYVFSAKRNITAAGRRIAFDISFDEYSNRLDHKEGTGDDVLYERVGNILKRIVAFLDTPLMKTVSQAPMLKPPIVRTNVLKMNPHFFAAYELYTYILAYDRDGYNIKENKESVSEFDDRMCELICDSILFQANIAYIGNRNIERFLEEAYKKEEEERLALEVAAREEKLKVLKEEFDSGRLDPVSYIKALEEENEKQKNELSKARSEFSMLEEKHARLAREYELSKDENKRLKDGILECERQMEENERQHRIALHDLRAELTGQMLEQSREFDKERKDFEERLLAKDEEIRNVRIEYQKREEELVVAFNARIRAARLALGEGTDEDNSLFREDFVRLESEKKAFDAYYRQQWSSAKKNIRSKLLWNKELPAKKEDGDTANKEDNG